MMMMIFENRWAGHIVEKEEGTDALKKFTGEITGKIPIERPRRR